MWTFRDVGHTDKLLRPPMIMLLAFVTEIQFRTPAERLCASAQLLPTHMFIDGY